VREEIQAMVKTTKNKNEISKINEIQMQKIKVFYKRSILKSIMKILLMEHSGYRTVKSVKNINRVFSNLDLDLYNKSAELISYIWCISNISKKWLEGIVNTDLIIEWCKRQTDFDNIKENIIQACIDDPQIISEPEAKMIFDLISEALQFGFLAGIKNEYLALLDDINLDQPGAFKELAERLFSISNSVIDIKHNTNFVSNKVTFNTSDIDSVKHAISQTIGSLSASNSMLKTGIRRLNTLLSPAYMNGRIYIYLGLPASFKSGILLKSALDIRKYNPDFKTKTPGLKPAVLYITMENGFTETIERIWNMTFDDDISNYTPEEASSKIMEELGIGVPTTYNLDDGPDKMAKLETDGASNIEIVIKYFSYREICTDDIFTIIQDLRDSGLEVCALVFDYIKRIRPNVSAADNVKLELDRICNELKAMSVILDIPVITAHQMNRSAASTVDNAVRAGKADVTKMVGRENVGSAWEVIEVADWACVLNIEYKPGTDDKYLVFNVVKRRRIDSTAGDVAKYTYLAHPFAKDNGLRLLDDIHLDKVLSLQSLINDIDNIVGKDKTNAVPRVNKIEQRDFIEDVEYDID
jgi:hypothetical protein